MRGLRPFFLPLTFGLCAACIPELPEKVTLVESASNVEVVSDPPNRDVYEPIGEVSAQVIGREVSDALRQAANMLRNEGAKKGATFVTIDDFSSRAAWDLSGRTIVTMVGTAYRAKP